MECPYCGAELKYQDYYGKRRVADHYYIYPQSWIEKTGEIYKCPNIEGFENQKEARKYQEKHPDTKKLFWEEVSCDSGVFDGLFYTDRQGDLHEGYPC